MTARLTWLLVALATFLATPSYAYTDQGGFGVGQENRVWTNFSEPGPPSSDFRLQLAGMLQTIDLASTATASGVGLLCQAHLYDYETGLYLMRARVYDPRTGSFLQRDPEGFVDSVNPYAGMAWDPINNRDPTGRLGANGHDLYGIPVSMHAGIRKAQRDVVREVARDQMEMSHGEIAFIAGAGSIDGPAPFGEIGGFALTRFRRFGRTLTKAFAKLGRRSRRAKSYVRISTPNGETKLIPSSTFGGSGGRRVRAKSTVTDPEPGYLRGRKHGIKWHDNEALQQARELNKPQGRWSKKDLELAVEKANLLEPIVGSWISHSPKTQRAGSSLLTGIL